MPALCDVNVLLALSYNGHIHHPQALAWLDKQADFGVGLCRHTQLGLLRLLSNPTVMGPDVCNLGQAWSIYDLILQDVRFIFSIEPEGLEPFLRQYSSASQVSPKLWQDAYLAAFARAAKMKLVTFDHGFDKFESLQLELLG